MNLRTARRLKDITQVELAKLAGVDQTTISDIERGKSKNPSLETARKIADALGVTVDDIFPATEMVSR
jgi:putative transcriptional regulator